MVEIFQKRSKIILEIRAGLAISKVRIKIMGLCVKCFALYRNCKKKKLFEVED